jgi:hypothetical protein
VEVDLKAIRKRARRLGLLIDSEVIRSRVLQGETVSSQLVVTVALVKGNDRIRARIIEEIRPEYWKYLTNSYGLILEWSSESLHSVGRIDPGILYQNMEDYVRRQVVPKYTARLEQVLVSEVPDAETLDRAIAQIKRPDQEAEVDELEAVRASQRVVLSGLIKGDHATQQRLLAQINLDHIGDSTNTLFFRWITDSLRSEGGVLEEVLHQKLADYVSGPLLTSYTASIDRVLAVEMPAAETLDKAIIRVQEWIKYYIALIKERGW